MTIPSYTSAPAPHEQIGSLLEVEEAIAVRDARIGRNQDARSSGA